MSYNTDTIHADNAVGEATLSLCLDSGIRCALELFAHLRLLGVSFDAAAHAARDAKHSGLVV